MIKPLLVFGYGNPGRGDDGLGPAFGDAVEAMGFDHIECLNDMQLQVEHVMDMKNRDVVLFVDADISCDAPFALTRLESMQDDSYSSHAMTPHALLFAYQKVYNQPAPPTFLLRIRGSSFELGDNLTPAAEQHFDRALEKMKPLLQTTVQSKWCASTCY